MNTYHKIHNVYKRDHSTNLLLEDQFSLPEFEMLQDIQWQWTEKIDGTNIRIMPKDDVIRFGGKTDRAQIPTFLLSKLQDMFDIGYMKEIFKDTDGVCLYGEGYGAKIQKGGNYIAKDTNFILFDIRIGEWWLTRQACEEIADKLAIDIVPIIGHGTLSEAVDYVRKGFKSTIAQNSEYDAEGLVVKPIVDLFSRNRQRIVAKIKYRDFK